MDSLSNAYKHLKKIKTHRRWVRKFCFEAGLYWQGIVHDLSKYSPIEFLESVQYFQGDSSPIPACKKDKGYSMAWFHHRGRNRHHWEYWVDNFDEGMNPVKMPYKYAAEMFCDFLAAGHAYMGKDYNIESEYEWWKSKREKYVIHPDTKAFIDMAMLIARKIGEENTCKFIKSIYYGNLSYDPKQGWLIQ